MDLPRFCKTVLLSGVLCLIVLSTARAALIHDLEFFDTSDNTLSTPLGSGSLILPVETGDCDEFLIFGSCNGLSLTLIGVNGPGTRAVEITEADWSVDTNWILDMELIGSDAVAGTIVFFSTLGGVGQLIDGSDNFLAVATPVEPVPEPSALGFIAIALAGLGVMRWRYRVA